MEYYQFIVRFVCVAITLIRSTGHKLPNFIGKIRQIKEENEGQKTILCLGDSLTEGFYNDGGSFHPYSNKLSALLNKEDDETLYTVHNEGISGEKVHKGMKKRLPELLKKYAPLDLVIILGGTNDLNTLDCVNDVDLFEEIKSMHDLVHQAGVKTVAMTIPEADVNVMPVRRKQSHVWTAVNNKLREYAENNDSVILFDLAKLIPYDSMDEELKEKYWDDNLHFTPKGYDKMGKLLFKTIHGKF